MADRERLNDFLRGETWAVVGASDDRSKFGNITFRELRRRGKRVFPVNRKAAQVEGETAYPSLSAVPEHIDRVLIVVPPKQSETVVQEADEAGIHSVWFQPGSGVCGRTGLLRGSRDGGHRGPLHPHDHRAVAGSGHQARFRWRTVASKDGGALGQRIARKSLTFVRVGPVTSRSPRAAKKP